MVDAFAIAVHGGSADYRRTTIGEQRADEGLTAVDAALRAGRAVLAGGGPAIDAVIAAVTVLERDGSLNAGRGGVRTEAGAVELDAAVADGWGRRAGAVAGVTVRSPIALARAVMDEGRHVLLVSGGAAALAARVGLELGDDEWFAPGLHRCAIHEDVPDRGTVGAVALDTSGHLAAATSTGGLAGSAPGRVGDSPLIGAGTWADDRTVALSATGAGEAFIRAGFAHHVHLRLLHSGWDLEPSCDEALAEAKELGGEGGCIAVARDGAVALRFTTPAMFRGWADGAELRVGLEPGECEGR